MGIAMSCIQQWPRRLISKKNQSLKQRLGPFPSLPGASAQWWSRHVMGRSAPIRSAVSGSETGEAGHFPDEILPIHSPVPQLARGLPHWVGVVVPLPRTDPS